MAKFKFVGEEPVDVPALALLGVEPGQVVDVDDEDVAAGLNGQAQWEPVKAARRPARKRAERAAKKAPAKKTSAPPESSGDSANDSQEG